MRRSEAKQSASTFCRLPANQRHFKMQYQTSTMPAPVIRNTSNDSVHVASDAQSDCAIFFTSDVFSDFFSFFRFF
eukprot:s1130_g6.t1